MIISTDEMPWDVARELTNMFEQIVTSDQIKKCNMELDKNQIRIQLSTVEGATKIMESFKDKEVQGRKVKACWDVSAQVLASPKTTGLPSSSSPHRLQAGVGNPQGQSNAGFILPNST